MKIIICGAGNVGMTVAKQLLINTGNDITIIDSKEENLLEARNLDVKTICGIATSPEILSKAGANYTDMIICVTQSDESNILTSHIAEKLFGIKIKISRVRSSIYLENRWLPHIFNKNTLAVDHIISPEIEVANHVVEMLSNTGIEYNMPINHKQHNIISIIITPALEGKKISNIYETIQNADIDEISICFIKRNSNIIFSNQNTILQKNDEIFLICPNKEIRNIIRCINGYTSKLNKVLICGGGEIGFNIAKELQKKHALIKIIEINPERCKFLSEQLQSCIVINGNMQDEEIIKESGIVDVAISVSGRDETNLFTTLIAKNIGIPECFTLIDEYHYHNIFRTINLKNVINTKDITISTILNRIGEKSPIKQETICDGSYSICEFSITKHSHLNGFETSKLSDIKMHIICTIRNDSILYTPPEKLTENDTIVCILPFQFVYKLEEMF